MDTIYALATAYGRSGIAVVRVSGPQALGSLKMLSPEAFPPRQAVLTKLINPQTQEMIDEAIAIYFQAPQSYTGEDTVEYNIHGGKAVRESLFKALSAMDGHRLAEAGEFTRRAFENGQMDLTQAEAVADLIHAETEVQKQLALSQMGGALSKLYFEWSEKLVRALAYAEAQIDFSEEDLPEDEVQSAIRPTLMSISGLIEKHLDDGKRGEILREGIKIAIIGAPNAGKSSLINALAARDVAIVSDIAGTTRDVLEVHLDIHGFPVTLYDTAGLRPEQLSAENKNDSIEAEGIRRALVKAREADFKILLFDGTQDHLHSQTLELKDEKSICVLNKADISKINRDEFVSLSAKTGEGLEKLIDIVSRETQATFENIQNTPSLTRERHRKALEETLLSIKRALDGQSVDKQAEDIRLAVRHLGKITGKTDVEDLLDIIFRDFCIGK